jgi:carboxypeptidase C (cathepsin A)
MTQSGYFDGGTDYFNAKFNMWQMDPAGKLQDRMSFKGYRSGHMMYLRAEDLANFQRRCQTVYPKIDANDL